MSFAFGKKEANYSNDWIYIQVGNYYQGVLQPGEHSFTETVSIPNDASNGIYELKMINAYSINGDDDEGIQSWNQTEARQILRNLGVNPDELTFTISGELPADPNIDTTAPSINSITLSVAQSDLNFTQLMINNIWIFNSAIQQD